jgi:hypothetical protein
MLRQGNVFICRSIHFTEWAWTLITVKYSDKTKPRKDIGYGINLIQLNLQEFYNRTLDGGEF